MKEMMRGTTTALLLLWFTSGCRSLPRCEAARQEKTPRSFVRALESHHVIELNANGLLYDLRPQAGHSLITDPTAVTNYLAETIWAGFKLSGKTNLLVFVHGGLNDRDQGLQHYLDHYEDILSKNYYPIFVVWPTSWGNTYLEHLLWVRQGIKMETVSEKVFGLGTSPLMLFADLGRGLTRLPMVVANNTRSDRETFVAARKLDGGAAVRDYQELAAEGHLVHIEDDYSRGSDRLLRDVSYGATLPIKYLTASLIDGLGQGAWDNMMRRTQMVYPARMAPLTRARIQAAVTNQPVVASAETGQKPRARTRKAKRERRYAAAGLPGFFESLEQLQKTDRASAEVTLIGHSVGAVILNRVIRDAKMDFANIVYLGAACSVQDFSTTVLPYMREHTNAQFYGLSLHPVAEAGEWYLIAGDLVPRGSLLVWIDNFLANPVSEEERTLGRWQNLFRSSATGEPLVRRFYDNVGSTTIGNRLHFRAFSVGFGGKDQMRPQKYQWNKLPTAKDIEARCNNPLSHGEFTEMPYWLSEFWWR
jgi:hypothetical protein